MKILICDDHALFREGLRLVLAQLEGNPELIEAADAKEALLGVEANEDLDLVLLDLNMPGSDGLTTLATLRKQFPTIPVVIVSASERPQDIRAALDGGASGFIPKSSRGPVLLSALQLVFSGGVYVPALALNAPEEPASPGRTPSPSRRKGDVPLTGRQLEVLNLMSRGLTNKEICGVLGIAEGTVKAHIAAIFEALDVTNRTEAAMAMRELGLEPKE
jgi:DNA-binding NarL/FixJ family response regulator